MSKFGGSSRDLFDDVCAETGTENVQRLEMPDADVIFYPSFFSQTASDFFFKELDEKAQWRQERIKLYGKLVDLPRLTAWYGNEGKPYTYSGITVDPNPWMPALLEIKAAIEKVSGIEYNSVLLNKYRGERDSVAWHSDDEYELGVKPVIGSVSFGESRNFQFKHKNRDLRASVPLSHGGYLLMKGTTQHHWLHQIPKQTARRGPRINLTFRVIK